MAKRLDLQVVCSIGNLRPETRNDGICNSADEALVQPSIRRHQPHELPNHYLLIDILIRITSPLNNFDPFPMFAPYSSAGRRARGVASAEVALWLLLGPRRHVLCVYIGRGI